MKPDCPQARVPTLAPARRLRMGAILNSFTKMADLCCVDAIVSGCLVFTAVSNMTDVDVFENIEIAMILTQSLDVQFFFLLVPSSLNVLVIYLVKYVSK